MQRFLTEGGEQYQPAAPGMVDRFRIATYNVHRCRGLDRRSRPDRIVAVLRELDADIVALQEVWNRAGDDPLLDQARFIAGTLGLGHVVGETRKLRGSPYGNVVLSRFDLAGNFFQLGPARYEDAIAAYSAAANQFPQDVRVLTAYMQMAQAYALSSRPVEARSMLEQAQVILDQRQIPDAAFDAPTTSLTRAEWNEWIDRARQVQR